MYIWDLSGPAAAGNIYSRTSNLVVPTVQDITTTHLRSTGEGNDAAQIALRAIFSGDGSRPSEPLKYPQGQGFIPPANMNRAGNMSDIAARPMHTVPSSSG